MVYLVLSDLIDRRSAALMRLMHRYELNVVDRELTGLTWSFSGFHNYDTILYNNSGCVLSYQP